MSTPSAPASQASLIELLHEARREATPETAARHIADVAAGSPLSLAQIAALLVVPETDPALFAAAVSARTRSSGRAVALFAPVYLSNRCCNECVYCAFRVRNREIGRAELPFSQIDRELAAVAAMGHRRVAIVSGAVHPEGCGFNYIVEAVALAARRFAEVTVNVPPPSDSEFQQLRDAGAAVYHLSQETFHRETYLTVHAGGPKRDFDNRRNALTRALSEGIPHVNAGVLLGLYDWDFEILALIQSVRALTGCFGPGRASVSVGRLEPAPGSPRSEHPLRPVSDAQFLKAIAILRLALPGDGILLPHTETPAIELEALRLGVTTISAGSRCEPGAYTAAHEDPQTQLGDHRSISEVIRTLAAAGFSPES